MRKDVFRIIIDLVLVFTFLTCSIPIWNAYAAKMPDIEYYANMSGLSITYTENNDDNNIFSVKGPNDDTKTIEFIVHNSANNTKKGNLVLKYAKSSTLDYKHLNVDINNETYNIAEFLMTQDETFYYFILGELTIPRYEHETYRVGLWLNRDLDAKLYKSEFIYNIEIIQTN